MLLKLLALSQGLLAEDMEDVKTVPVKQKVRPALPEPALPPRVPTAAKTLLLFDFDKTLTDYDAGDLSLADPVICQSLHVRTSARIRATEAAMLAHW